MTRPAKELIRLAMIYAEQDRRAMAEATREGSPEHGEAAELADAFHAYRMRRWGRTQFEADIDEANVVTLEELRKR